MQTIKLSMSLRDSKMISFGSFALPVIQHVEDAQALKPGIPFRSIAQMDLRPDALSNF